MNAEWITIDIIKDETLAVVVGETLLHTYGKWLMVEGLESGCGDYNINVRRKNGKPIKQIGRSQLLNTIDVVKRVYFIMRRNNLLKES